MKCKLRYLLSLLCIFIVTGCQPDASQITMQKDGVAHIISEDVQFYYPKGFTLETKVIVDDTGLARSSRNVIELKKDNEILFYTSYNNSTDNTVSEREILYTGDLEVESASNIVTESLNLNSGIKVLVVTGVYSDTGTFFKHLVHFSEDATNIYGYYSDKEIFTKNVDTMTKFLESLVISNTTID